MATTRIPLSRERVLRAAVALADREGLDALSMRRLGRELGVEAMSLYNHVANKEEILRGILDLVMAEIPPPCAAGDWQAALRANAIAAHEVLLRHPWACALVLQPANASPARWRWMDGVLRTLREAGFSVELTHHAYHALDSHIIGFTLWLVSLPALGEQLNELAADFLRDFPAADYPWMLEHIEYHLADTHDDADEGTFAFGLDLILDGLERRRDAEEARRTAR